MTIFEYVSVTISIILGLAMARLLSIVCELVIDRKQTRFHWVPLAWVTTLFILIIVLWWQLFSVGQTLEEWTFLDFGLATVLTLPLFVASALFLPNRWSEKGIDLFEYFIEHGKWGVGAYMSFFILAILANYRLFGSAFLSANTIWIAALVSAAVGTMLSRSRLMVGVWSGIFVTLQISNIFYVLFPSY